MKKFAHNRRKMQGQDKENLIPINEFRNQKFSVELPCHATSAADSDAQKSIFNEQISVTLNTNSRSHRPDGEVLQLDVKALTQLLGRREEGISLKTILTEEMYGARSVELKMLLSRLIERLDKEGTRESSMTEEGSGLSTSEVVGPLMEQELQLLQENYDRMQKEYDFRRRLVEASQEGKAKML